MSDCVICKNLYDDLFATYTVYDKKINTVELNPFFFSKLEQRLQNKAHKKVTTDPKLILKLQPIAASVLVLVGISMGVLIGNSLSGSGLSLSSPDRTEIIEAYATDYYFNDANDETVNTLINNE